MILGLEFPPLSHIVDWPYFALEGTPFAINKVVLVYFAAIILTMLIFVLGNQRKLVPTGAQNLAESMGYMLEALILAIVLIYLILAWVFASLSWPPPYKALE